MDIALIGIGRVSKRHLEALAENKEHIHLKYVCDVQKERADQAAATSGAQALYDIKMIPPVDAMSFATPSGLHPEHVQLAAKHCQTKYIVCEKPISLTVKEALTMFRICEENNKILLPVYQNRYNPLIVFIKKLIDSGKLGTIFQFNVNIFWNRNDEYFQVDWHGTRELDGGVLYTQASHYVDMLHFLFGEVETTKGIGKSLRNLEVHDTISSVMSFQSGVVGSLNATVSVYDKNYLTEFTIIGEKGTVRLSGTNLNTIDFWKVQNMEKPDMDFTIDHQYGKGHDALYSYLAQEKLDMFPNKNDVLSGISLMERLSY